MLQALRSLICKNVFPPDLDPGVVAIIKRVRPFTMTSPERVGAFIAAIDYVIAAELDGAIVECGVWRGGSMMAAALRLLQSDFRPELYLFDTYEGMPQPSPVDVDLRGRPAQKRFARSRTPAGSRWCLAGIDEVRRNLESTGYPMDRVHFVKGMVETTIPAEAPEQIAILRLDTDWYESTKHELAHLYPRVTPRGVLIIDDYGYWKGSRRAVDEFLADRPLLVNRIDITGRLIMKTD